MAMALRTRRFTADEYLRMAQVGILSEDDRVELIDGEVLAMSPIGPRHGATVDRATRVFTSAVGSSAIVRVQGPVRLNLFTQPGPDILLLRPRDDYYALAHPGPEDVLLVVEVSESSIGYDRDVKATVYAQGGVQEYWLIDLNDDALMRFRSPLGGTYHQVEPVDRRARIAPILLPNCVIDVESLVVRV